MKRPRKPREGSESRAARRRLKAADGERREQLAKRSPQPTASAKGALSPRAPVWVSAVAYPEAT